MADLAALCINPSVYHRPMDGISADLTAFVLAGGKSTRMGTDKAFVTLDGRTLLARALELARSVTPNVRIVGDPAKFAPFAPVVEDVFRGCGPLGGIHAALRASQTNLNLILAVDVPFVSPALLQYLIARARTSASATVTAVRAKGGWQPLCAVYRPQFADAAEEALGASRYKIDALFDSQRTQTVSEDELESAGFSPNMFRNLNTRQELAQAAEEGNSQKLKASS
ncbi:MAG: molybdenum cofactor guanylyltransferase [Candidatus Sulfotelmatobacter sp.]